MTARKYNGRAGSAVSGQAGVTLIELMVALTISTVLIFGATQVYLRSRNTYQSNESVTRLQESARYAMSIVEVDVRNANYFGLTKSAYKFAGQAVQALPLGAVAPGPAANVCGNNFAIDLNTAIQGDDNSYVLSASRQLGCDALSGWTTTAVTTADTLTIRRASIITQTAFTNNTLQLCSGRGVDNTLFSTAGACLPIPNGQINNLIVNAYYVDQNSAQAAGLPSLRRKALAPGPAFIDEEVIAGVEDMQIQFGIEAVNPAVGATGQPSSYINPRALLANEQVVAVRLWLLVRSDSPEPGFSDNRCYEYAARVCANGTTENLNDAAATTLGFQPSSSADESFASVKRFRRLLVSRTMYLRDAYGT
jgi:type IV pilus assembly protein PilW